MATETKMKAGEHELEDDGSKKSKSLSSKLPPWLSMAIKKPRVWKTWVRCMIATFATLILMLVQPCM
jgi:hypothetical protein